MKCPRCKKEGNFFKCKSRKSGLSYYCKECRKPERLSRKKKDIYHVWRIEALRRSKQRALKLNLQHNIDYEYLKKIHNELCPILGLKLDYLEKLRKDSTASLERIDNGRGYIKGNVCIISLKANRIKCDSTLDEMKKIFEWYKLNFALVDYFIDEFKIFSDSGTYQEVFLNEKDVQI